MAYFCYHVGIFMWWSQFIMLQSFEFGFSNFLFVERLHNAFVVCNLGFDQPKLGKLNSMWQDIYWGHRWVRKLSMRDTQHVQSTVGKACVRFNMCDALNDVMHATQSLRCNFYFTLQSVQCNMFTATCSMQHVQCRFSDATLSMQCVQCNVC